MKKILTIALVAILTLSLLTACGNNSNTPSGGGNTSTNAPSNSSTPSGNSTTPPASSNTPSETPSNSGNTENGDVKMSITVATGWKASPELSIGDMKTYMPETAFANTYLRLKTEENYRSYGEREYVEKKLENEQIAFDTDDYDYTAITELTIGGNKAFEYSRTDKKASGDTVRQTFIVKGENVYLVEATADNTDWDSLVKDFDAMRDSLTLK